jgi:hypothetical protein
MDVIERYRQNLDRFLELILNVKILTLTDQ